MSVVSKPGVLERVIGTIALSIHDLPTVRVVAIVTLRDTAAGEHAELDVAVACEHEQFDAAKLLREAADRIEADRLAARIVSDPSQRN